MNDFNVQCHWVWKEKKVVDDEERKKNWIKLKCFWIEPFDYNQT